MNETADGQLDWYFESVPPDRLTELKARYPSQVHLFTRNNTTYFVMNERKYPFDKLAVRQAVNYAIDRPALVKIFGGQGTPTENILPPGFGSAYQPHHLYPHDVAKAKALIQQAGVEGANVTVWGHNTDPTPKAVQYMAGVLNSIGLQRDGEDRGRVGVLGRRSRARRAIPRSRSTTGTRTTPSAQDWLDVLLNGEHIVNVGNNDVLEHEHPRLQHDDRPGQAHAARCRSATRSGRSSTTCS